MRDEAVDVRLRIAGLLALTLLTATPRVGAQTTEGWEPAVEKAPVLHLRPESGPLQDAGTSTSWFGGVFYEGDFFTGSDPAWPDWRTVRALAIREWDSGALGVETTFTRRFGRDDASLTLDGYLDLWPRAYGNLRLRVAPDADVLPLWDGRGELFHAFESGWEVSGYYWHMNLPVADVNLAGAGLGKYHGDWYLRARAGITRLGDESTPSFAAFARRFVGGSRQYVELSAGVGEQPVTLGPGPLVDTRTSSFVRVTAQRFVAGDWGIHATAGYHDFEGIPARRHLSVGVVARF